MVLLMRKDYAEFLSGIMGSIQMNTENTFSLSTTEKPNDDLNFTVFT